MVGKGIAMVREISDFKEGAEEDASPVLIDVRVII